MKKINLTGFFPDFCNLDFEILVGRFVDSPQIPITGEKFMRVFGSRKSLPSGAFILGGHACLFLTEKKKGRMSLDEIFGNASRKKMRVKAVDENPCEIQNGEL